MHCLRRFRPWLLLASLNLLACGTRSGGEDGDAAPQGEAGAFDAGSTGDASGESADAHSEKEDGGEATPGTCGCSYGYHQHCGPQELCMEGYGESAQCQRPPRTAETEQLLCTRAISDEVTTRSCNAQCVTAQVHVSPCSHRGGVIASSILGGWASHIQSAFQGPYLYNGLFEHLRDGMRPTTNPIDRACEDFLGWTALGLLELCGGPGLVAPPALWEELNDRRISQLPMESCQARAALTCIRAVSNTIDVDRERVEAPIRRIRDSCPNGLPFGPPCNHPDPEQALACVTAHVKSIARALRSGDRPAEE